MSCPGWQHLLALHNKIIQVLKMTTKHFRFMVVWAKTQIGNMVTNVTTTSISITVHIPNLNLKAVIVLDIFTTLSWNAIILHNLVFLNIYDGTLSLRTSLSISIGLHFEINWRGIVYF